VSPAAIALNGSDCAVENAEKAAHKEAARLSNEDFLLCMSIALSQTSRLADQNQEC